MKLLTVDLSTYSEGDEIGLDVDPENGGYVLMTIAIATEDSAAVMLTPQQARALAAALVHLAEESQR